MTRDAKQAERQRRYHVRKKAQALAVLGGGTEIELAWFGTNANGEHVAIGMDGQRIDLVAITGATFGVPETPVEERPETKAAEQTKKVYAPKSWDAEKWDEIRAKIIDMQLTKDSVRRQFREGKTLDDKQKRQAIAVVDAMPDTADWYVNLPTAEG